MKDFISLYRKIDSTTSTNVKVNALVSYFSSASDKDKVWTIALFTRRRPKRSIRTSLLREWAAEVAQIPNWLFEESYHVTGDLAETISLVLPASTDESDVPLSEYIGDLIKLQEADDNEKKKYVLKTWQNLSADGRFLFNKLLTGGFRMGVSQNLITRALANYLGTDPSNIAHRLMGNWQPNETSFSGLLISENYKDLISKPYPFYLAYSLDRNVDDLGAADKWSAEWKWDGIRIQLIKRAGEVFLWSRGEELVTAQYPEVKVLDDEGQDNFVIDGELVAYKQGEIQAFNQLQKRIGRKRVSAKTQKENPIAIICYDLLEYEGKDLRNESFISRRDALVKLLGSISSDAKDFLRFSPELGFESWEKLTILRSSSRSHKAEGVMLKLKTGPYKSGRRRGEWWKWKVDPMTIDAVMIYAQRGHGRRSTLFTDFTFAVWDENNQLVPFAKAYSGLTDDEFREVSRFVQQNTIDRFGPVRSVNAKLVFEVAFEGINKSKRHKSGIALRFPRISRWRKDKKPEEANTLKDLHEILATYDQ